eukprot:XP_011526939.1 probable tubulin polyglutamylase TTLL9 isoform X21 [Homo sapiens]
MVPSREALLGPGTTAIRCPKKLQNQNYKGHGLSKGKEREQRASIRFKTTLMNTLMDVLRHRPGWVEVKDEGEWDFYWCDVSWLRENFDHTYMDEHVRISHFRNHYELTRKNYMVKNLKRFRKQLEREAGKLEAAKCDFFPKTFEMPCEYHLFVEEFRKNPGITWIMKPVARSQGKGIFLFRRLKDIVDWRKDTRSSDDQKDDIPVENYVAQRYIENPYLIGGRKFDLRVYVLVMSVFAECLLWSGHRRQGSDSFSPFGEHLHPFMCLFLQCLVIGSLIHSSTMLFSPIRLAETKNLITQCPGEAGRIHTLLAGL